MQENIITWNVANWITVVLMAMLGFMIMATVSSFVKSKIGSDVPDGTIAGS